MNQLMTFDYEENTVRVIQDELGDPWWVAKDVCDILEHSNHRVAVDMLEDDEKGVRKVYSLGGDQEMIVISESGLYTLIIRSNKPEARPFRRWVTHEVLPAIRKQGLYDMGLEKEMDDIAMTTAAIPVTVARLSEAAQGIKAAMIIARAFGFREDQARSMANEMVKELTGIDVMDLMKIPEVAENGQSLLPSAADQPKIGLDERMLSEFVEDCCEVSSSVRTAGDKLYWAFLRWFRENHGTDEEAPSRSLFTRRLGRHFRAYTNKNIRMFAGVAIKGDDSVEMPAITRLVQQFIKARCDIVEHESLGATELYEAFKAWFIENNPGLRVPTQAAFGRAVPIMRGKRKANGTVTYDGIAFRQAA